ncbi:MFS transporter [Thermopolyspora sp. NPDC052614]|uniref:MFS transporter n=1 Tax=Thermopolyspora sp. NPDC052614 TaxID=3155682 RepID=UPI003414C67B
MATARDLRARFATFAVFLVQGLTLSTLLTQVATLQRKHGLGEGELTLLLLVVPVIAGVGSVLAGALASRLGSRTVLRVAQPLACAAVLLVGAAPNIPTLLVGNALFGLCLGAVDAGMNMQAVATERAYGRAILNGFHCLWSVGAVIGSGWASLAGLLGLSLLVTIVPAMVLALAVQLSAVPGLYTAAEEHTSQAIPDTPAARPHVPWGPILPLCLAMAFLYVGDATVSNFGSVYMDSVLSASAAVVPLALGAYQATTLLVRVFGDFAVRRYGPAAVVRLGGALATLGFTGLVVGPNEGVAIAAFALTGVGLSVIAPQVFSAAGRLDPAGTGVAVARVNLFNYIGFIVGAAVVGGLADAWNFRVGLLAPLVLAAVLIALAPAFRPKTDSPDSPQDRPAATPQPADPQG